MTFTLIGQYFDISNLLKHMYFDNFPAWKNGKLLTQGKFYAYFPHHFYILFHAFMFGSREIFLELVNYMHWSLSYKMKICYFKTWNNFKIFNEIYFYNGAYFYGVSLVLAIWHFLWIGVHAKRCDLKLTNYFDQKYIFLSPKHFTHWHKIAFFHTQKIK